MSLWTKEKMEFKREIGNSQPADKMANKFLLSNLETMGQRGIWGTDFCMDPSCLPHFPCVLK